MTTTPAEGVTFNEDGDPVVFAGREAVDLYRVTLLKSAIQLYKAAKVIPTRGMTITKMLAFAGKFTEKTYRRGDIDEAIKDLDIWIKVTKSTMPGYAASPASTAQPSSLA